MPYKFAFTAWAPNPEHHFECHLQCQRCSAVSARTGQRCRNRVCIGLPTCWVHLLHGQNLRVRDSAIPGAGKGLFALAPRRPANAVLFRAGQTVCEYGGDLITRAVLDARYPGDVTAPYALQHGEDADAIRNAACRRGVGSLANHATAAQANTVYVARPGADRRLDLVATRDIRNGDEVTVDYGDEYELHQAGVASATRRSR